MTFSNAQTGASQRVDAVNATIKMPGLDEPMSVAGDLTWNNEGLHVVADVANPRAMARGSKSGLTAVLEGGLVNASFKGDVTAGQPVGAIDIKAVSARKLATWLGLATSPGAGFGAMTLSGEVATSANKIALKGANFSVDAVNGSGEIEVS